MDWLVSGRKGSRPGLSLPLVTSAELGREAHKQEVAQGPWKSLFHGKLLGIFLYNMCPKPLADPWFLFPPPLSFFLLKPCLCPSIQLPLGGLGGSECSQPLATSEGQPSPRWRFQPAGVTESGHPVGA